MEKLREVLEQNLNENLHQIIISNRRSDELAKKIVLRPFAERGQLMFQFAEYRNKQVFHKDLEKSGAIEHIIELLQR